MKIKKKAALSLLLAAMLCASSCARDGTHKETDGTDRTDTAAPITEVSRPDPADSEITLFSGESSIALRADENMLRIASMKTPSGSEIVSDSEYVLPAGASINGELITFTWRYDGSQSTANTAEYRFTDDTYAVSVTVRCTAYTETEAPFVFDAVFENNSGSTVFFTPADFASVTTTAAEDAELWSFDKESGYALGVLGQEGTGLQITPLTPLKRVTTWTGVYQNANAGGYIPSVYLNRADTEGLLVALEWTSGKINTAQRDNGQTAFSISMDCNYSGGYAEFSTRLDAEESFVFPSVYFMAYDGDVDDGSNLLKSWFYEERVIPEISDNPAEPLTQMDMQRGLEADLLNVDAIKWDYGWWSEGGFDGKGQPFEGSWELRNEGYRSVLSAYGVSTLAEFGALAKSRGVSWTVYLLLHDTLDLDFNPTNAYGEFNSVDHPEWFSNQSVTQWMGACADLGNEACVAYLQDALTSFFSDNNITTWRSDFQPIPAYSNKVNRHAANGTDVVYWCTVGFTELLDHLYANLDGFRYECCSSGGSLKDLYTARRSAVFQIHDDSHYLSARTVFYDTSYVLPAAQLQFALNADYSNTNVDTFMDVKVIDPEEGFDLHGTMMDMGYRTMMLGVPMFSSWTGTIEDAYYVEYGAMYHDIMRDLVKNGSLYHILPRPDGTNWDGVMYADPDTEREIKGAVFLFKPSDTVSETYHVVMRGLDDGTTYTLTFEDRPAQNTTASGAALMTEGIEVEIKDVGSEIIWIREAAE